MIRLHNLTLAAAALAVASQWTAPSLAQDQRNVPKPPPQQQNKHEVPRPPRPDQHPQNHPPQNQYPQNQYPPNQRPQNQQRPVENSVQHPPKPTASPQSVSAKPAAVHGEFSTAPAEPTSAPRSVSAKPAAVHGEFNTAPSEPAATPEHPRGRKSCRGLVASLQRRATDAAA